MMGLGEEQVAKEALVLAQVVVLAVLADALAPVVRRRCSLCNDFVSHDWLPFPHRLERNR